MMDLPDSYTVRLVDLPVAQGGMISESPDGHINVYINARHAHDQQILDAEHEFDHWRNDDLHNDRSIQEVEADRLGHSRRLPKMKRARDLIPRVYKRANDADDWTNDVYLRMGHFDEL